MTKFSPSKTLRGTTRPMGATIETAKVEVKEVQIKTLDKNITALRQNISSFRKEDTPNKERSMNQSTTSEKKQAMPETMRSGEMLATQSQHQEVKSRPIVDILNEIVSNKVTS